MALNFSEGKPQFAEQLCARSKLANSSIRNNSPTHAVAFPQDCAQSVAQLLVSRLCRRWRAAGAASETAQNSMPPLRHATH